jgi:hypothetical protein
VTIINGLIYKKSRDKCVTTAWRVFRLRVEERPAICRVAANTWSKQLRAAQLWLLNVLYMVSVILGRQKYIKQCYEFFRIHEYLEMSPCSVFFPPRVGEVKHTTYVTHLDL